MFSPFWPPPDPLPTPSRPPEGGIYLVEVQLAALQLEKHPRGAEVGRVDVLEEVLVLNLVQVANHLEEGVRRGFIDQV